MFYFVGVAKNSANVIRARSTPFTGHAQWRIIIKINNKVTDAVREAAFFIGFNEKTAQVQKGIFACHGHFPEAKRGKYN